MQPRYRVSSKAPRERMALQVIRNGWSAAPCAVSSERFPCLGAWSAALRRAGYKVLPPHARFMTEDEVRLLGYIACHQRNTPIVDPAVSLDINMLTSVLAKQFKDASLFLPFNALLRLEDIRQCVAERSGGHGHPS